jgi:hypothetical protein
MNNSQTITMSFKKVYTCKTVCYNIDANLTMKQFIGYIKSKAYNDFNIDNNYNIEIVEAGQIEDELAPPVEPCETTISEKYGEKIKYTSFYIRPKLDIEIPEININNKNIYNNSIPSTPRPK